MLGLPNVTSVRSDVASANQDALAQKPRNFEILPALEWNRDVPQTTVTPNLLAAAAAVLAVFLTRRQRAPWPSSFPQRIQAVVRGGPSRRI
jgi:hypothetical protein